MPAQIKDLWEALEGTLRESEKAQFEIRKEIRDERTKERVKSAGLFGSFVMPQERLSKPPTGVLSLAEPRIEFAILLVLVLSVIGLALYLYWSQSRGNQDQEQEQNEGIEMSTADSFYPTREELDEVRINLDQLRRDFGNFLHNQVIDVARASDIARIRNRLDNVMVKHAYEIVQLATRLDTVERVLNIARVTPQPFTDADESERERRNNNNSNESL